MNTDYYSNKNVWSSFVYKSGFTDEKKDSKNRIVLNVITSVVFEYNIKNKNDLMKHSDGILRKLKHNVDVNKIGEKELKYLFKSAVENYSRLTYCKNNENCQTINLKEDDLEKIFISQKKEKEEEYFVFEDDSNNKLYGVTITEINKLKRKSLRSSEEDQLLAAFENPNIAKTKFSEITRLNANYDKVKKAQTNIVNRSEQIHNVLSQKKNDRLKVKNLIIGAGVSGEQLWRTHFKDRTSSSGCATQKWKPRSLRRSVRHFCG